MNDQPKAPVSMGLFVDPLADWANDDLLINPAHRAALEVKLKEEHPGLFDVLDWPRLRETFDLHNKAAGRSKRMSRRLGLLAIALAGAGVILMGAIPALGSHHPAERPLSLLALGAMTIGGILGLMHWGILSSKSNWLGNRFWTERLRQLYFQSLVNNLDLAIRATNDVASLEELKALREKWIDTLYVDPQNPHQYISEIVKDRTETNSWLRPEWHIHHPLHSAAGSITGLLEVLYRQRLYIQYSYASKNLGPDIHSPHTRARILGFISLASILAVVAIALAGVAAYAREDTFLGHTGLTWAAVAAVLSAIGLTARAANEGLQNESDADRYEWYSDAVKELMGRFQEETAIDHRVRELRRMEEISYQELRRFLRTHHAARFLM